MRHLSAILSPLIITTILFSCSNQPSKNKYTERIKQLEENLLASNKIISTSTELFMQELEDKTTRPETHEIAIPLHRTATSITDLTTKTILYLDSMKKTGDIDLNMIDLRLQDYKTKILSLDSNIQIELSSTPLSINVNGDKDRSLISNIQSSIRIWENKLITYCLNRTRYLHEGGMFTVSRAIVGQSSNIFKPGQEIEIFAGIGEFSRSAQPIITFDGEEVKVGIEGSARFKRMVPKKPGNYTIPVSIKYFNQMAGEMETHTVNIEYTVAKPCAEN